PRDTPFQPTRLPGTYVAAPTVVGTSNVRTMNLPMRSAPTTFVDAGTPAAAESNASTGAPSAHAPHPGPPVGLKPTRSPGRKVAAPIDVGASKLTIRLPVSPPSR